jgi:hypothetical protein
VYLSAMRAIAAILAVGLLSSAVIVSTPVEN